MKGEEGEGYKGVKDFAGVYLLGEDGESWPWGGGLADLWKWCLWGVGFSFEKAYFAVVSLVCVEYCVARGFLLHE